MSGETRGAATAEYEDIIQNLNFILNTKKQYGSIINNFGMRDLNEFYDKEGIAKVVIEEISENIKQFEPRIKNVEIINKNTASIFQMAFILECQVFDTKQSLNVTFDTVFNSFIVT